MSSPFCFLRLPRDPNPKGPPPKGLPPNIPPNKSPNMSAGNPITENTDKDIKSQCQATVQLMILMSFARQGRQKSFAVFPTRKLLSIV